MSDPPEPLPPVLDALLATERGEDRVPDAERRRLRERVLEATVEPPSALPRAPYVPRARAIQWGMGLFALGTAAGIFIGRATTSSERSKPLEVLPNVAQHEARDAGDASAEPLIARAPDLPAASTADLTIPVPEVASVPKPAVQRATHADGGEGLMAERTLVDRARSAMLRGDAADARRALAEHARRYPTGALAEEREYLIVRALLLAGSKDDARRQAERYRSAFGPGLYGERIAAELRAAGAEAGLP